MGRAYLRAGQGLALALALSSFSGPARAAEDLGRETRDLVWKLDQALAPGCAERTLVEAEPARWVLDRCGTRVAWDVRTAPATGGGRVLTAALAPEGAPVSRLIGLTVDARKDRSRS